MARRRRIPDDWVETDLWRRWPAPRAGLVEPAPGAPRQLRALLAGRARGLPLPLPAVLLRDPHRDGVVNVAAAGYIVARLTAAAAGEVRPALDGNGRGRIAVCGLIRPPEPGRDDPDVALWLDRRLGPGFEVVLLPAP